MLAKCQLKSGIPFAIISDETDFLWPARCHSGWCHLLVEGPIPRGKIASWIGLPWKLPLEKTFSNSSVCFVVTPRKAKQNIAKPRPKKGMTLIIFPNIISTRSANSIWLMKKPVQTKQSLRFWEVPSPKIWHPSKKANRHRNAATPQLSLLKALGSIYCKSMMLWAGIASKLIDFWAPKKVRRKSENTKNKKFPNTSGFCRTWGKKE